MLTFAAMPSLPPSLAWIPSAGTVQCWFTLGRSPNVRPGQDCHWRPPVALNARTVGKLANWRDPAMLAKLADAYAQGKDHEGAARLLGVTVGAARLAKWRYLDRLPTDTGLKSPPKLLGGRFAPGLPP